MRIAGFLLFNNERISIAMLTKLDGDFYIEIEDQKQRCHNF
jgi:hypothetical protein